MGFFDDLKTSIKEQVGPLRDAPGSFVGGVGRALTRTEEGFQATVGAHPGVKFEFNAIGRSLGIKRSAPPTSFGNGEDLKFTNPQEEEIYNYAMMAGLDEIVSNFRQNRAAGKAPTAEELAQLVEVSSVLGSLYNGSGDAGSTAALEAMALVTSVSDDDYGSQSFYASLAKLGSQMVGAGAPGSPESELTESLAEQQALALESQRIQTLMAQRNYEREGIMSVIQMLPSSARLQFMADLFTVPKFGQLFFGDLDAGSNDGPYVGGVLGSQVQQTQGAAVTESPRSMQDRITQGSANLKASLGGAR